MPLNPIAQKMIDDSKASGRPNAHLLPVETARENFENTFAALEKPPIHETRDVAIPTRDGETIRGRLYLPSGAEDPPLTVYYHGGGWLLGSIDSHDVTTRLLATASESAVLSVDYRRGPDHRFPTAVNDAIDALEWARVPGNLPVDVSRVAVAGDSAGGNLAAAVALEARDRMAPLAHQLLIYPVTTCDLGKGFDDEYEGIMLERDEMQWHQDNYLPGPDWATDPRVSVLDAKLKGLVAATVILAECDPIRPQGELYAQALREADVPVEVFESEGLIHGFFGLDQIFPTASEAMEFAGKRLREAFATGATR
ncbi:Acetyl esterase [Gordonia paraffinivorans]|uniref:Acetyl esterase n=1 Tax=Gordonia paraffinivorans TaxID=175628 RepID=A0ABD7V372_9ACTN|nr:alpha/beta hydrolase [Gordonia paraffinivorans]VFA88677.1 Acetyl esterase [Gordonia paraffinivorans]